jgi:signal transduction histidine kinase
VTSLLPSQRFREVQLLIGVALVLLLTVAVAELQGIVTLASLAREEARHGAAAVARALAASVQRSPGGVLSPLVVEEGTGVAVVGPAGVTQAVGEVGPEVPAWWPWMSRREWEAAGQQVAGPLDSPHGAVVVAYQPLGEGRVLRVVRPAPTAPLLARWPIAAAVLTLAVAGGGAMLAWLLLGRALAPYGELLGEAARVGGAAAGDAEDRYLVDTFRTALRRLEESEAMLRRRADELAVLADVLTREAGAGVVILDREGRVRGLNAVAAELLPGSPADGAAPTALLPREDGHFELAGRTVEVRRLPLLAADGDEQGAVVFLTDRSREEALERALHEREEMATLGELAAGMAHELRNAVATITGYLRLLGDADGTDRRRFVAAMEQEARSLAEVLDRFLRFAQPQDLKREPLDVAALVRERAAVVGSAFPAVATTVAGDRTVVLGDRLALSIVVDNLLRNAAEAAAEGGGKVEVEVVREGDRILVAVADNGAGVSPDVRDRLFAPFVSSKPSGGLGLVLARRFARLHGGDVAYEPRPGGGSLFTVQIPGEAPV